MSSDLADKEISIAFSTRGPFVTYRRINVYKVRGKHYPVKDPAMNLGWISPGHMTKMATMYIYVYGKKHLAKQKADDLGT